MVLRLRTLYLRAEVQLLHCSKQKRLFATKGYFPRGIGLGFELTGGECGREGNAQRLVSNEIMARSWSNWHLLACGVSPDGL